MHGLVISSLHLPAPTELSETEVDVYFQAFDDFFLVQTLIVTVKCVDYELHINPINNSKVMN